MRIRIGMLVCTSLLMIAALLGGATRAGATGVTGVTYKPEIGGVLDRDGMPSLKDAASLNGFVINAHWADLQPTAFGPIASNNVIDKALAEVRGYNATHAHHLFVKIRLFTGIWAPTWAKTIGGSPIKVYAGAAGGNATGTIGRFWLPAFGTAYLDLVNKLAVLYDSAPELEEVTVSRCMTIYDEPFIRQMGVKQTVTNLLAAGFTAAQDLQCLEQQMYEASLAWVHTRVSLAYNPYQHLNSDGTGYIDETFTETVMQYCRQTLGTQCVLENNSIRDPLLSSAGYKAMYKAILGYGPPITFQTMQKSRVGNLAGTLTWAVDARAGAVELPTGYDTLLTATQLQKYGRQLAANAVT